MGTIRVAKSGEQVCGDNWACFQKNKYFRIALIDGLGHGKEADKAAVSAMESMEKHLALLPNELLREVHEDIRKTRGAVMSVAYIDTINKQLMYCGIGNISTRIVNKNLNESGRGFNSYNGIVGHTMPGTINNHVFPWDNRYDALIMHSDGLMSRWDLAKYPGIFKHHAVVLCAALYKDCNRGTDDTTVAVIHFQKSTR